MATYYPCLSNQTDFLSSPYLKDQMYLPQASTASYTELLSTNSISLHDSLKCPSIGPGNELEFICQTGNSPNLEPHDGEQSLRCQGLALSLGTQIPSPLHMPHYQYQYTEPANSSLMTSHFQPEDGFQSKELKNAEYFSYASHGGTCNEMYSAQDLYKLSGPVSLIHNSKYLKAAQQLLDEVVNVQKALKHSETDKQTKSNNFDLFGSKDMDMTMNRKSLDACDSSAKGSSELSPSERQNSLDKLTKLCSMVDEVDRRYRQYCHQMQIVVSSFEMVAGRGAAKSYTALARYTISRQFRCLLDAINHLIQVVRQSLGEQDTMPGVEGKLTRLRYVGQQLRQQRALQQFGVMRHTWRPQRGLPENSVSILRAWLFEHFLHPYPKDSEKIMLARQTGLTRGQVGNWFINARVRLWKPMVEEMYKEEFGEIDSNTSLYPSSKTMNDKLLSSEDMKEELKENVTIKTGDGSKPTLIPSVGMKGCTARLGFLNGPHEENNVDSAMVRLQDDFNLSPDRKMPQNQNGDDNSSKFPAMYDFPELGTFSVAKQVLLALGLQQGEKDSLLIESSEMQFGGHDAEAYHCVDP